MPPPRYPIPRVVASELIVLNVAAIAVNADRIAECGRCRGDLTRLSAGFAPGNVILGENVIWTGPRSILLEPVTLSEDLCQPKIWPPDSPGTRFHAHCWSDHYVYFD